MSTIAKLSKAKATHPWNIELYQSCLNEVQNYIETKNYKPNMEKILFFTKEAYVYSLEGGSEKADLRFTKWIVDSHG